MDKHKYVLYLGLTDKDTKQQTFTTTKAMGLVHNVIGDCTISPSHGYWQDVKENTLIIEVLFSTLHKIKEYCNELKQIFNQECIAVQIINLNNSMLV